MCPLDKRTILIMGGVRNGLDLSEVVFFDTKSLTAEKVIDKSKVPFTCPGVGQMMKPGTVLSLVYD